MIAVSEDLKIFWVDWCNNQLKLLWIIGFGSYKKKKDSALCGVANENVKIVKKFAVSKSLLKCSISLSLSTKTRSWYSISESYVSD